MVRSATGTQHPKYQEIVHPDLLNLQALEPKLAGYDACFFCLGATAAGLTEAAYAAINHDIPVAVATVLARINPAMAFVYVSGAGTDSSEHGRIMWARVQGKTENDLLRLDLNAYMLRPRSSSRCTARSPRPRSTGSPSRSSGRCSRCCGCSSPGSSRRPSVWAGSCSTWRGRAPPPRLPGQPPSKPKWVRRLNAVQGAYLGHHPPTGGPMEKREITRAQLESMLKRVLVQALAENTVVVPANDQPKPEREQVADLADLDPLTRKVAQALGLGGKDATKAIRVVFEALAEVLRENLDTPDFRLRVHALGTFRVRHFAARNRSNPRTAMITWVPAHIRLAFRFTVGLLELGKPRG